MRHALVLASCLSLVACSSGHDDVKQWMQEATKDLKGRISPLPEIKPFPITAYEGADLVEPFSPARVEPEKKPGKGLAPDVNRRKEPLESYPLESLKMVGTVFQGNVVLALIQADKTLHQVRTGNHMGQNFGKVVRISESEVVLRELVQDAMGEYGERTSTLQLQEKQQEGKK